jgi:opacity protein-like surface antigen
MMSRALRGVLAATVLVAATATAAEAQASSASRFGLSAGVALPMGDFGDVVGLGFQIGGHFQMPLGSTLKLRINADWGRYGGDVAGLDNATLLGGMANLVLPINTTSDLKPYIFGGLGFYQYEFNGTGGSASESDMAFNVGVGYDFTLGNSKLFTEIRYLSIQSDPAINSLPIVIGLRF